MPADFVHLHVHTQYSLLDGAIRIKDLIRTAKQYQLPAVTMTDHGNLFGAIDFYNQAVSAGIKPIIGCELYVAPGNRLEKSSPVNGETSHHLIVLAENTAGYKNLLKLVSAAYLEGFYYRPRVDKTLLAEHHEGLIAMSACLHGEIAGCILQGNDIGAIRAAEEYRELFGKNNFFLEIMENGLLEQQTANRRLLELSGQLSIPLVATNDCHYLTRDDARAHEVLLCIQTGKTLADTDRMRFETDQFYYRNPSEMQSLFSYCPEAIKNTVHIADRCTLQLALGQIYLPKFEVDKGKTLDSQLADLARVGLEKRMPTLLKGQDGKLRQQYEMRLEHELKMITAMGFSGYFLIVADFVNYAKEKNIPVGPGRGSAAGSLVAYAIGITDIDPIRYNLFFERFLNPDRISMPDIDIDFCQERRDEIISYVTKKYGADRVAQIITFGTMQARAVIRDVGRVLNFPYGEVDAIAKLVPNMIHITLESALEMEPRLREAMEKNERIAELLTLSRALEGLNRHASTHAAGVVISDIPLVQHVPLYKNPKDDSIVTQFTMKDIEKVGLAKFDFLGLKTLTVIKNTLQFIREGRGVEIDLDNLSLDDPKTYNLLSKADTDGVFQLESSGMKDTLSRMKPACIEDLIALISLFRPGPMNNIADFINRKHGKTKISYEVPALEPILKETCGVIVYQEQVMQIASVIGNYTMSEADILRKVMSKKKFAEMEKEKPKFLAGAKKNKIPEMVATKIWEQMETFAEYGFNKSHSTAYAMISYQTAYLKAHYPVEFMAAVLTSEKDNRDKIIQHINSCKDAGIDVLPPDINESFRDFSASGESIRFGMAAVKHVGVGAIEAIIEARARGGRFKDFVDFCSRVDMKRVNKRMIESLIKCGAFDALGHTRRSLMSSYDSIIEAVSRRQKDQIHGQESFLDDFDSASSSVIPAIVEIQSTNGQPAKEWDQKERLAYEKETLGFYITGHPMRAFADRLGLVVTADSETIRDKTDRETVMLAGIVSNIRDMKTKRKETMAQVTFEDLKGSFTAIFFAEAYRKAHNLLHSDEPLLVKGTLDIAEDDVKVLASEVLTLSSALNQPFKAVHFTLDIDRTSPEDLQSLRQLLLKFPGKGDGFLRLQNNQAETIVYLGEDIRLELSTKLKKAVDQLLGEGTTRFV
jgi:DNA polymerase-3 subunit alpha